MVGYDDYRDRSYGSNHRNQHGRGGRGRGTFKRRGYHSGGNRRGGYGRGFGRSFVGSKMESVDREKMCPLLLRVFPQKESHRKLDEFVSRGQEPKPELRMYTWMDATLKELYDLVQDVHPDAQGVSTRLSFALIYPDRQGRNVMRQIGTVQGDQRGRDDDETLQDVGFQIGDFLSVAIY